MHGVKCGTSIIEKSQNFNSCTRNARESAEFGSEKYKCMQTNCMAPYFLSENQLSLKWGGKVTSL